MKKELYKRWIWICAFIRVLCNKFYRLEDRIPRSLKITPMIIAVALPFLSLIPYIGNIIIWVLALIVVMLTIGICSLRVAVDKDGRKIYVILRNTTMLVPYGNNDIKKVCIKRWEMVTIISSDPFDKSCYVAKRLKDSTHGYINRRDIWM